MSIGMTFAIIVLMLLGAIPTWPHSKAGAMARAAAGLALRSSSSSC
jgi:hypothetical protein